MGALIHLSVGRLEIDWGKNSTFADHSSLFQSTDLMQVSYYYVADGSEGEQDEQGNYHFDFVTEYRDGLSKPLWQVIDRINLLGHTLEYAKREFEYLSRLNRFDMKKFSFDQLAEALATVDVNTISVDYGQGEDFGEFFRGYLYDKLGLAKIVGDKHYVRDQVGEGMENLSAYTVLQLVARNPSAKDLPVTWQFADVEDDGYAHRTDFVRPLDQSKRFLIVTEGSSDATIIHHAIKLLKPHLIDFFDFVDMNEGYPFSGTGNLFNFTKGLISIAVQNNVVILYDNDAEGVFNFNRTSRLNVPRNMRILKLPDRPEFFAFQTLGPSGNHTGNINRRAAAIECYLDVGPSPKVRWTSYNRELDAYQGELVGKTEFMRRFFDTAAVDGTYNLSKISSVVDMLISECGAMREAGMLADLQRQIENEFPGDDDEEDVKG
ncbi:MAG: HEPN/Toprim-associated domain-containing protein [Rhodospirillales bacterium]